MRSSKSIHTRIKIAAYGAAIFVLVGSVFMIFATILQFKENRADEIQSKQNEENIVSTEKSVLNNKLNGLVSDIDYLSYTFNDFEDANASNEYEKLEENWKAFLDSKEIYLKLRFIDVKGNEVFRINYSPKGSYCSKKQELQYKGDRYYFTDTIVLDKNQVFISKLDLDMENNKILQPIEPTLRLSKTIFDATTGDLKGIVILSCNARYLLDEFKEIAATSMGSIALLNSGGYWLYTTNNKDNSKEWAFMYDDKKDVNFTNEAPQIWQKMESSNNGTIVDNSGLYTYSKVSPFITSGSNYDKIDETEIVSAESWQIVSFIPSDGNGGVVYNNDISKLVLQTLKKQRLVLLVIFLSSLAFSSMVLLIQQSKKKIKALSLDKLTGVYNRRMGMELLEKARKNMIREKGKLSICFIDINGLKVVNDNLGHDVGDEMIKTVTTVIKKSFRGSDFIIRFGGDEFLIVFVNANQDQAENVWKRITNEYKNINIKENRQYFLSVSHGIQELSYDSNESIDAVITSADQLMYQEKRLKKSANVC